MSTELVEGIVKAARALDRNDWATARFATLSFEPHQHYPPEKWRIALPSDQELSFHTLAGALTCLSENGWSPKRDDLQQLMEAYGNGQRQLVILSKPDDSRV